MLNRMGAKNLKISNSLNLNRFLQVVILRAHLVMKLIQRHMDLVRRIIRIYMLITDFIVKLLFPININIIFS